jgi:hypothetical protein
MHARELTDDEVAFYHEQGWVKMERLIPPEVAGEIYRAAVERQEPAEGWGWTAQDLALAGIEPVPSFVWGGTMGRNVQRLMNQARLRGQEIGLRWRDDAVFHKEGRTQGVPYHQDSPEHGSDRVGELQFWLALGEATPEMGTMRFVERSHREGPLGSTFNTDGGGDTLQVYPRLVDLLGLSDPLHYQPGDATVHHGLTVHGSPPNETDRPRLNMLFSYAPADTRCWEGTAENHGSRRTIPSDERYPIVVPARQAVPA